MNFESEAFVRITSTDMAADERATLAAELKRAFTTASAAMASVAKPVAIETPAVPPSEPSSASISFTMPLLRAVLSGHKTQTRRPIRPVPTRVIDGVPLDENGTPIEPLCRPGERLWVREKWARIDGRFVYAIDEPSLVVRWISSRFMPRAAARWFLRAEKIDVARLSAMDGADALREGAASDASANMFGPRAWFIGAWDAIYGEGEFASTNDPWVWVISFTLER